MKQNGLFLFFLLLTVSILFYSIKENEKIIAERKNQAQSSEVFDGTSFDKRRNEYMYNMVKDPVTGRIPDGIIENYVRKCV